MIFGRETVRLLTEQIQYLKEQVEAGQGREAALVARIHEMKRQGFTAPDSAGTAPVPNRLPPEVETAIAQNMNPSGDAAKHTARIVREWMNDKVPTGEIVARIHRGAGG